uniref:Uncharacterized protein n=1 Tax=Physcomitrium patens TaxID=3218 RepID=A0A2K1IW04_PHYPA|nr:hypothetical protein PHYPA_025400 [Physcomitrium patens]
MIQTCGLSPCPATASKGEDFLEAPVSRSKHPAEQATLIILTAGRKVHWFLNVLHISSFF